MRADTEGLFKSACAEGGLIVKNYLNQGGTIGDQERTSLYQKMLNESSNDPLVKDTVLWSGFKTIATIESDQDVNAMEQINRTDTAVFYSTKPNSTIEQAERFAAFCLELLDMLESQSIDIIALVNKLFAECKGSQQAKGKEMANKLTDEQWEAYKKARTGRPITTTREQHFTQRYKNANKPNATKKAKATKKPK